MRTYLYSLRTYLCSAFSFSSCALRLAASSRFFCVAALLSRLQDVQSEDVAPDIQEHSRLVQNCFGSSCRRTCSQAPSICQCMAA